MENQEEIKELNEDEEKLEKRDKNKFRRGCVSHAGLGFVAGYITAAVFSKDPFWLFPFGNIDSIINIIIPLGQAIFSILGGLVGGALFKKWWGAVIGGGIANIISFYLTIAVFELIFNLLY